MSSMALTLMSAPNHPPWGDFSNSYDYSERDKQRTGTQPQHPAASSAHLNHYAGQLNASLNASPHHSHVLQSNYSAGVFQENSTSEFPTHSSTDNNVAMWPRQPHSIVAPNHPNHLYTQTYPHNHGYPAASHPLHHPEQYGESAAETSMPWGPSASVQSQPQASIDIAAYHSYARVSPGHVYPQFQTAPIYSSPPERFIALRGPYPDWSPPSSQAVSQSPPWAPPISSGGYYTTQDISEVCRWTGCNQIIRVTGSYIDLLRALKSHFDRSHNNTGSDLCGWQGCVCKRVARDSCGGRAPTHPAHVRKMWVHIYRVHLHHLSSQKDIDSADFPGSPSSSAASIG